MTTKEATDLVGILLLIIFVLLCVIWTLAIESSSRGREIQDHEQENKRLQGRIDTLQSHRATQARQLDRYKGRYG